MKFIGDYIKFLHYYDSPLGKIILASDGENLLACCLPTSKYPNKSVFADKEQKLLPVFEDSMRWLDIYFAGEKPDSLPKIKFIGSDFQISVWKILKEIPYGKIVTYKDIAKRIAENRGIKKMSAQAVGGAVGHNPINIIIPCHRVVGTNHSLVGYGGGINIKSYLLKMEGVDIEKYTIPKM